MHIEVLPIESRGENKVRLSTQWRVLSLLIYCCTFYASYNEILCYWQCFNPCNRDLVSFFSSAILSFFKSSQPKSVRLHYRTIARNRSKSKKTSKMMSMMI